MAQTPYEEALKCTVTYAGTYKTITPLVYVSYAATRYSEIMSGFGYYPSYETQSDLLLYG